MDLAGAVSDAVAVLTCAPKGSVIDPTCQSTWSLCTLPSPRCPRADDLHVLTVYHYLLPSGMGVVQRRCGISGWCRDTDISGCCRDTVESLGAAETLLFLGGAETLRCLWVVHRHCGGWGWG